MMGFLSYFLMQNKTQINILFVLLQDRKNLTINSERCFWLVRRQFFNFFLFGCRHPISACITTFLTGDTRKGPHTELCSTRDIFQWRPSKQVLHSRVMTTTSRWCVVDFSRKKSSIFTRMAIIILIFLSVLIVLHSGFFSDHDCTQERVPFPFLLPFLSLNKVLLCQKLCMSRETRHKNEIITSTFRPELQRTFH